MNQVIIEKVEHYQKLQKEEKYFLHIFFSLSHLSLVSFHPILLLNFKNQIQILLFHNC